MASTFAEATVDSPP